VKTSAGTISGVVTAFVTKVNPQREGQLELKFRWLSDTQKSTLAPVAAPLAGANRGAFFMPEVGDEVLVAFDHGDFNHPFVVGYLWNGTQPPPESTGDNRVIVTPGGHTLRFEDKDGARKVVLKSSTGHVVTLDDAGKTVSVATASGNLSLTLDDGAQTIVLSGGGRKISISGGTLEVT
jgi:uncharacterized protein involved in type VI secretion and phage assembly